jgi:predicted ribosome quality control (RQC) complex YloA/Tae2 family protein
VNDKTLEAVANELKVVLPGRRFGKIFPLSRRSFAVDLRFPDSQYLLIAAEPASPRVYLIRRRLKDLERSSVNFQPFHLHLRKHLSAAEVTAVEKLSAERILVIRFIGTDDTGETVTSSLMIQLTGRSSNIFLLDDRGYIVSSLVEKDSEGQRIGEDYSIPVRPEPRMVKADDDVVESTPENGSISAALDRTQLEREADERFRSKAENARRAVQTELAKRRKLIVKLRSDLAGHGDAEKWKRYGDLILANLSSAKRSGGNVRVTDFFDEDMPEVEIEADEHLSLTDAAQKYFRRYTKAQNAAGEIQRRIDAIDREIAALQKKWTEIEKAIDEHDENYFEDATEKKQTGKEKKQKVRFAGARQFTSSDGFEILVGKRAVDNDHLTFRIAGSLDLWLHAADYSGSHVVVRNPNRKDIPSRTLLEAAMLAAFYSSGKSQPKAAVHYTQKKFVNKPKGAAPGLVRLASFKTIMVEPSIPEALDQKPKI